jgi:hypothetical protein
VPGSWHKTKSHISVSPHAVQEPGKLGDKKANLKKKKPRFWPKTFGTIFNIQIRKT